MSEEVLLNGKSLKEFKVSELKAACKERNLPISGNKSALIKKLKAAIELENLQKAARSSPAGGSLPNSEIADGSQNNDFIKQYMENQRKLLQSSTSSRFSSTSEADSEDEAASHKAGTIVSPLARRSGRRATRDSRDSHDSEPAYIPEDQRESDAQATVKSTSDEESSVKLKEINSKSDQLPAINENETTGAQSKINNTVVTTEQGKDQKSDKVPSPNEAEHMASTQVSGTVSKSGSNLQPADSTQLGSEDDLKIEATEQDTSVDGDQDDLKNDVSKQDISLERCQVENDEIVEKTKDEDRSPVKEVEKVEMVTEESSEKQLPPDQPQEEKTVREDTKPESPMQNEEVTLAAEQPLFDQAQKMEKVTEETKPQSLETAPEEEMAAEETKPQSPEPVQEVEMITEETVVDVEEMVNQEEELDYDENEGLSHEKSEISQAKDMQEHDEEAAAGRRLHWKKKEKLRKSKSPDHIRKRRKRSMEIDDQVKLSEEKKGRKRIKRQSLDKTKMDDVEETQDGEAGSDVIDSICDAKDKEEETISEEKTVEPDEPLVPLRRINRNRRESDSVKVQKRKWGGRSTSTENVNISSDLIKDLIDIKSEEITKAINEQEEIGEEPGELVEEEEEHEEVDEIIDIVMEELPEEGPAAENQKLHTESKDGEEDGEIVEEEEVVVEEFEEGDSAGEEKDVPMTHHDNRKVVTSKSTRKVEQKADSRNRKVISQSDQNGSHKEIESNREKKREIKKKSIKTSVSVDRSGPKQPTPPPEARDVSPSRYPVSKIIHIRNLVRPFTLPQLKNFLGKLGKVQENSFWIDKIKSHCLLTYETEGDATNARRCLHGINWPTSNPKTLSVDFCDTERANSIKEIGSDRPIPPLIADWKKEGKEILKESEDKPKKEEIKHSEDARSKREDRDHHAKDESARRREKELSPRREERRRDERRKSPDRKRRDDERRHRDEKKVPLREWDRDKLDQEAEHRRLVRNQEHVKRSPRREERRERRQKEEPKIDEQPAKLLDDLFRKTKATPCIYWLPLTDEQAAQRIKEREQRREARNKIRREMEEEDKSKGRQEPARRPVARSTRSPGRRLPTSRTRHNSTNDRRPIKREHPDSKPSNRNRERPSPPRKRNRSPEVKLRKTGPKQSDSSSSSDSSSGSDSDSDSGSSSASSSSEK